MLPTSPPAAAVIIVGNWLATMRHEGLVNGAYQMAPVGNFIVAVMGPIIDPKYHEVGLELRVVLQQLCTAKCGYAELRLLDSACTGCSAAVFMRTAGLAIACQAV